MRDGKGKGEGHAPGPHPPTGALPSVPFQAAQARQAAQQSSSTLKCLMKPGLTLRNQAARQPGRPPALLLPVALPFSAAANNSAAH